MVSASVREEAGPGPMVDWTLAAGVAKLLVGAGPEVSVDEAVDAVRQLRALAVTAEGHVRDVTGLGHGLPMRPGKVVDRAGWIDAATSGLQALTDGVLGNELPGGAGRRFAAGAAGLQAGLALGYLGSRVLGQYDPYGDPGGEGQLLLVAPNVVAVQRVLDVPASDFRLWVCLHEATHRLQFTAVPWLRGHFSGLVSSFLSTMDSTANGLVDRLPEAMRAARRGQTNGDGLIAYLQSPQQREALNRLLALATLLEGHADHVMDAVGPQVVPSVATIRTRFTARRRGGGLLDRLLRALLGVDAKVRQYTKGAAFTRHVVDAAGMDGFNVVWSSEQTLPTRAEIDDPAAWLRRVVP